MSWVLVLYLVLGVAGSSAQQIQYKGEGEVCKDSPKKWFCRTARNCPRSMDAMRQGWRPEICSYKSNREKILCCPPTIEDFALEGGLSLLSSHGAWDIPIKGGGWIRPGPSASTTTTKGGGMTKPVSSGGWDIPVNGGGWDLDKHEASTTSDKPKMLLHPVVISTSMLTTDFNRSIAKANQMCKQYLKHQYQEESFLLFPGAKPTKRSYCGRKSTPLVFGGEDANPYEFPHMAMIGYGDEGNIAWKCGGSLISERFVLSAAHCSLVHEQSPKWAKLGDTDLTNDNDVPRSAVLTVKIAEIINHPDYKKNVSWYNDIALYKLEKNLELGIFVRPACLNTQPRLPDNKVVICGFGLVKSPPQQFSIPDAAVDDAFPTVLQKAELDVIPLNECNNIFKTLPANDRKFIPNGIKDGMVCAGGRVQKAACNGDSGGPLQSLAPECMYDIVGVTSFGYGCKSDVPGVYSNVVDYLPWIVSNVWGDN